MVVLLVFVSSPLAGDHGHSKNNAIFRPVSREILGGWSTVDGVLGVPGRRRLSETWPPSLIGAPASRARNERAVD